MKKVLALAFVMLFCGSAAYAGRAAYAEPVKTDLAVKNVKTLSDGIIKGCKSRGWISKVTGTNEITATLENRSHVVVVRITYSKSGYEIIYKDSQSMSYNAQKNTIHGKYTQWVANLNKSIKASVVFTEEI